MQNLQNAALILGIPSLISSGALAAFPLDETTNWAQPPVGCIEELMSKSTPSRPEKIELIYSATKPFDMPPHILYGALVGESALKNLGISNDGGNYSCGIGQLNVREWCEWANTLDGATRKKIRWPTVNPPCDEASLPPMIFAPFFEIAHKRAPKVPSESMGPEHYANISFESVKDALTAAKLPPVTDGTQGPPDIVVTPELVRARFDAATSFAFACKEMKRNIHAKAFALNQLYIQAVPKPLQKREHYAAGDGFKRKCLHPSTSAYPLHTGWLMAVGMYNAGKKFLPRIAYYYNITKDRFETDEAWANFNPKKLVEGLYAGGVYNPTTGELNYTDLDGNPIEASWYKACIAQRHVAHVGEYVALPGHDIIHSMSKKSGCSQKVPLERQTYPTRGTL